MKARSVFSVVVACVGLMTMEASAAGQNLYPVQGPLVLQSSALVFRGNISRPMFSVRTKFQLLKSWTINGETLNGKCNLVTATSADLRTAGAPDSYPPQPNLAFAWDLIKGQGYYVSHVLGNRMAQGIFTGNAGTVLQVESVDNESGVAVDNKGNIYKIVW